MANNEISLTAELDSKSAIAALNGILDGIKEIAAIAKKQMEIQLDISDSLKDLKTVNNALQEVKNNADIPINIDTSSTKGFAGTISTIFSGIGSTIQNFLNPLNLIPNIFSAITGAAGLLQSAFSGMISVISGIGSLVTSAIMLPFQAVSAIFNTVTGVISSVIGGFTELVFFVGNLGQAFDTLLRFAQPVINFFTGIYDALKNAVNGAADFERQISNVASVTKASAEDMDLLTQAALQTGATTSLTAAQAAEALYKLGSAGLSTKDAINSLAGTAKLAEATQADLAQSTELVVSTLSQYGMEATQSTKVANVFAAGISSSQLNMERLGEAMKYIGPLAGNLGMSLEATVATLGALHNAGIMGERAGTALRNAFTDMLNPAGGASKVLGELGLSLEGMTTLITDSTAKGLNPFVETLNLLQSRGIDTAQAMQLFGDRGGPAMVALLGMGTQAITDMEKKVTGTNSAFEMAAVQLDNYRGASIMLQSAIESLQISIGTTFQGALKNITQVATDIVSGFIIFIDKSKVLIAVETVLTGTFEGLKNILNLLSPVITSVSNAFSSLFAKMSSGVMALVDFVRNSDIVKSGMANIASSIKSLLSPFDSFINDSFGLGKVLGFVSNSTEKTGSAFAPLKSIFSGVGNAVKTVSTSFTPIADVIGVALDSTDAAALSTQQLGQVYSDIAGNEMAAFNTGFIKLLNPIDALPGSIQNVTNATNNNAIASMQATDATAGNTDELVNFNLAVNSATNNTRQYSNALSAIPKISLQQIGTPGQLPALTQTAQAPPPLLNPSDVGLATPERVAMVNLLKTAMVSLKDVIITLTTSFIDVSKSAITFANNITQAGTFASGTVSTITTLTNAIKNLTVPVISTISSITNMITTWLRAKETAEAFKISITALFDIIKAFGTGLITITSAVIQFVSAFKFDAAQAGSGIMILLAESIKSLSTYMAESIKTISSWTSEFIKSGDAFSTVKAIFNTGINIFEGIINVLIRLPEAISKVLPVISQLTEGLSSAFADLSKGNIKGAIEEMFTSITNIVLTFIGALSGNASKVTSTFMELFTGLKAGFENVKINTLDPMFAEFKKSLEDGLIDSISNVAGKVTLGIAQIGTSIVSGLKNVFSGMKSIGVLLSEALAKDADKTNMIFSPVIEAIKQGIDIIKVTLNEGIPALTGIITPLLTNFIKSAAEVVDFLPISNEFKKGLTDILFIVKTGLETGEIKKMFKDLTPAIVTVIKEMTAEIKNVLAEDLKSAITSGLDIALATILASVGLWALSISPAVAAAFTTVGTAIVAAVAAWPIAFGVAIVALTIAVAAYLQNAGLEWASYFTTALGVAAAALVAGITGWPVLVLAAISGVGLAIYDYLIGHSLIDDIPMWFAEVFNATAEYFKTVGAMLSAPFMEIWSFINETITVIAEYATQIGETLINTIVSLFDSGATLISTSFNAIWTFMSESITTVIGFAKEIADGLINTINDIIIGGKDIIIGTLTTIWDSIKGMVDIVVEIGGNIGKGLMDAISGAIEAGVDAINAVLDGIVSAAQATYDKIMAIVNLAKSAASGISNLATSGTLAGGTTIQLGEAMMATGGIIKAQQGGTLVRAAEAGKNEAFVPLPNGNAIPVSFSNLPDFSALSGNASNNVNINFGDVNINNDIDEREFFKRVESTVSNALIRRNGRR